MTNDQFVELTANLYFYTMNQIATIDDLRKVIGLSELPEEHLQWLLDHTDYEDYEDGTLLMKLGDPADWMWILLEGSVTFYMDVNGRQVHYFDFRNDSQTGGIGG